MRWLAAGVLLFASSSLAAGKPLQVVAFDIEPIDLAQTHELDDLLGAESRTLRRALADSGLAVVDTRPVASEIDHDRPLSGCNGCDLTIARTLGADVLVTTMVQEIQYPVFGLYATARDAATGRVLRKAVATIEGLDAEDWGRGVTALVKNHLLERPLPADGSALRELVARTPVPPE